MNNSNVEQMLKDCRQELDDIERKIQNAGTLSSLSKYLTKYSLIKITGTFEYSYKNLIADYYTTSDIESYLTNTIRDSSSNPSLEKINTLLKNFDESKKDAFKDALKGMERNKTSLSSLNSLRNDFAHGKSITVSFSNLKQYFNDSVIIFEKLDNVLTRSQSN